MSSQVRALRRGLAVPTLTFVVAVASLGVADVAAAAKVRTTSTSTSTSTSSTTVTTTTALPGTSGTVREERLRDPDRVVVSDDLGVVATYTVGARTVTVRGPQRTFAESTTTATVTSTVWVRLLAAPFTGTVDYGWLGARLADGTPDVLEVSAQYVTGAPTRVDADGERYASDASYGPLQADGTREEGSDFNDYLGVSWTYGTTVDDPEADQYGAMDCSGYVRTVFGYRFGLPMTLRPDRVRLPRRAVQMADSAPGVVVVPNTGATPKSLSKLLPGDLVFFDASTDDGTLVDHVGIYLGLDSAKAPRFVSSRKRADGPTLGDLGGRSTLSGTGLYATTLRAVRRL